MITCGEIKSIQWLCGAIRIRARHLESRKIRGTLHPATVCTVSTAARFVGRYVELFLPLAMVQRLEDRIKALCLKAATTRESPELADILQQLKGALAQRMRKLAAGFPGMARPERRSTGPPPPHSIEAEIR